MMFPWSVAAKRKNSSLLDPFNKDDYFVWVNNAERRCAENKKWKKEPTVSLLIDVRGAKTRAVKRSLESVLKQGYDNCKIYVVIDASEAKKITKMIKKNRGENKTQLIIQDKGKKTAEVFNETIKRIHEGLVGFVRVGDVLGCGALSEMVEVYISEKSVDLVYSDEDKIDSRGGRSEPHFKPDYSPDTLLGFNYVGDLALIKVRVFKELGGLNEDLRFAWDYDLYLKIFERGKKVAHVQQVLYHKHVDRAKDEKMMALEDKENMEVIQAALARRGVKAKVEKSKAIHGYYDVIYDVVNEPLVSIIIPIKDHAGITEICLKSIYGKTKYKNYEVIIVNNRSEKEETFKLLGRYEKKYKNFRVVEADMEFNYSAINNLAVKNAKGKYVVLMNNDIEVIDSNWIERMVGFAMQPHVGAVGALLLYRDEKIQHAGVILGLGASRVAGHAYHNLSEEEVHSYGRISVPYDYSAVTAACLCLEKKKFEEVGGMEEALAVAFNDVDLNLRLMKNGYYNVLIPGVKMFHDESKSRGLDVLPENQERFIREMNLMKVKWKEWLARDKFYNDNFSLDASFMLKGKEKK